MRPAPPASGCAPGICGLACCAPWSEGSSRPRGACLFADALGLPIEVPDAAEVMALGAALVAGVGAGLDDTLDDAVRSACRVAARFDPDTERHRVLTRRFDRYVELGEAIRPILAREGDPLP